MVSCALGVNDSSLGRDVDTETLSLRGFQYRIRESTATPRSRRPFHWQGRPQVSWRPHLRGRGLKRNRARYGELYRMKWTAIYLLEDELLPRSRPRPPRPVRRSWNFLSALSTTGIFSGQRVELRCQPCRTADTDDLQQSGALLQEHGKLMGPNSRQRPGAQGRKISGLL